MTSSYNICDSTKYDKMQLQHKQTNKQTNKQKKQKKQKNKQTNKQTNTQTNKQTQTHKHTTHKHTNTQTRKHTRTHMFLRLHIMGLPEIWEPLNPLVHDTQTHWLTLETGC